jgi:signal peptidase II
VPRGGDYTVNLGPAAALASAVVVLDRITKILVLRWLELGEVVVVFPGWLSLTHVLNQGAAFGILGDGGSAGRALLIAAALATAALLGWLFVQVEPERVWERAAIAAVVGGALGNLIDRLTYGAVVDFLDVHAGPYHWPAFNVADSAITVGCSVLLLASFRQKRAPVAGDYRG